MDFMTLAVWTLACWRISHMFVYEDGPLDIVKHFRKLCKYIPIICDLIKCIKCFSVWVAAVMAIWMDGYWLVNTLAVSAGSLLVHIPFQKTCDNGDLTE